MESQKGERKTPKQGAQNRVLETGPCPGAPPGHFPEQREPELAAHLAKRKGGKRNAERRKYLKRSLFEVTIESNYTNTQWPRLVCGFAFQNPQEKFILPCGSPTHRGRGRQDPRPGAGRFWRMVRRLTGEGQQLPEARVGSAEARRWAMQGTFWKRSVWLDTRALRGWPRRGKGQ